MINSLKSWNRMSVSSIKRLMNRMNTKLVNAKLSHNGKKVSLVSPDSLEPTRVELASSSGKNYFVEARSWADDMYTSAIISRNRYKLAFFVSMGLAVMLTIAVDSLIPMEHMQPLLVNHYQDGRVSVQPINQANAPTSRAQVESEIVRYIINRESYDPSSYNTQYALINLMSDHHVAQQYRSVQSSSRKSAPINVLGNHGWRSVHVDSVVFLDSAEKNKGKPRSEQTHHDLAQVNFTVTDHMKNSAFEKTKAYTSLISWNYRGTPSDPADMWRNWDGFNVTRYSVDQRNV